MDKQKLRGAREWIQSELKKSVDFWLKNGMDEVNGGVYTCLDRRGEIYSTDKSVWMQGRCGWIFAYLSAMYTARARNGCAHRRAALTLWRRTA